MTYTVFDDSADLRRTAPAAEAEALSSSGDSAQAMLGFVGKAHKLSIDENRRVVDCATRPVNGRLPNGATVAGIFHGGARINFRRAAKTAGANLPILRSAQMRDVSECADGRFFGIFADGADIPIAPQIARTHLTQRVRKRAAARSRRSEPEYRVDESGDQCTRRLGFQPTHRERIRHLQLAGRRANDRLRESRLRGLDAQNRIGRHIADDRSLPHLAGQTEDAASMGALPQHPAILRYVGGGYRYARVFGMALVNGRVAGLNPRGQARPSARHGNSDAPSSRRCSHELKAKNHETDL